VCLAARREVDEAGQEIVDFDISWVDNGRKPD
jgi:hypothetical protein